VKRIVFIELLTILLLAGCEKDITLDLPVPQQMIVVEGHIENGSFPYVILTRNQAYFSKIDPSALSGMFVHNAQVTVSSGNQTETLQEICLSSLPAYLKPLVYQWLGITEEQATGQDYCAYVSFAMTGQTGRTYRLDIQVGDTVLAAHTSIPNVAPVDSIWTEPDPVYGDSLVWLWVKYSEPDTLGNFYRYFTRVNSEPFYPGYFGSVWDDQFTNGQQYAFSLAKGEPRTAEIDFDTYGLFHKGDTVVLKLASIDHDHYQFWRTLEDQRNHSGPFSSPVYISDNIEGGLGIWGGYGVTLDTIIIAP